jgi:hypothetical protein
MAEAENPQDDFLREAQKRKLEAESQKLLAEAEEVRHRVKQPWWIKYGGQTLAYTLGVGVIGGFFTVATFYFQLQEKQLGDRDGQIALLAGDAINLRAKITELTHDRNKFFEEVQLLRGAQPGGTGGGPGKLVSKTGAQPGPGKPAAPADAPSLNLDSVEKQLTATAIFNEVRKYNFSMPGSGLTGNFNHDYKKIILADKAVVVEDKATGLMWQQGGSEDTMTFAAADLYIQRLNRENFAGFKNWRLPTIVELISLVEPAQREDGLYIDDKFSGDQRWCMSQTEHSKERFWGVVFYEGKLYFPTKNFPYYVRAVRTIVSR